MLAATPATTPMRAVAEVASDEEGREGSDEAQGNERRERNDEGEIGFRDAAGEVAQRDLHTLSSSTVLKSARSRLALNTE